MEVTPSQLLEEYNSGIKVIDLSQKYGRSRFSIARLLKKAKQEEPKPKTVGILAGFKGRGDVTPIIQESIPTTVFTSTNIYQPVSVTTKPKVPETVEAALTEWNNYIGYSGEAPKTPKCSPVGKVRKIVVAGDIHAPFQDKESIKALIKDNADDTDLLIISGDLLDLFSVSRYEKFEQHFSLAEEFRAGKALINLLASNFKRIRLLPGNHDERWKKHLVSKRGMGPGELGALSLLAQIAAGDDTFNLSDPLYCLCRDLPNVEIVKPVRKDYAQFSFFCQEGDLIVSHAEKFSRTCGQAASQASQWFKSFGLASGICKDFSVLVQAHTHQYSMAYGNFGVWNIEGGCLCLTPDYAGSPKLMGAGRPSVTGYTVIYQDENGKSDMTKSRFIPTKS